MVTFAWKTQCIFLPSAAVCKYFPFFPASISIAEQKLPDE